MNLSCVLCAGEKDLGPLGALIVCRPCTEPPLTDAQAQFERLWVRLMGGAR